MRAPESFSLNDVLGGEKSTARSPFRDVAFVDFKYEQLGAVDDFIVAVVLRQSEHVPLLSFRQEQDLEVVEHESRWCSPATRKFLRVSFWRQLALASGENTGGVDHFAHGDRALHFGQHELLVFHRNRHQ
jgi:hypothetical protein